MSSIIVGKIFLMFLITEETLQVIKDLFSKIAVSKEDAEIGILSVHAKMQRNLM